MAIAGSFFSAAVSDLSWALEYGTAVKNPANNKINMILINFIISSTLCRLQMHGCYLFKFRKPVPLGLRLGDPPARRARLESNGYADEKCRGMMEYWKVGLRLVELRAYGSERIMGSEG
jgi:hypothetical protein